VSGSLLLWGDLSEDGSVIYSYNCFWALPEQSLRAQVSQNSDHILLSHFRLPQPGRPVPVFTSSRNRAAQLYPQTLGSLFVASYDSQSYGGGILTCLHTGHSDNIVYSDRLPNTSRRTKERTFRVTSKRHRRRPLIGKSSNHIIAINR
jgi:hypothetical protein